MEDDTQILFTEYDGDQQQTLQTTASHSAQTSTTKPKAQHKGTQTRETEIRFSSTCSKNEIVYSTRDLPQINNYPGQCISDPRNEDVARIILYELERLPEKHRISAFAIIFNDIKKIHDEVSSQPVVTDSNTRVNAEEARKRDLQQRVLRNMARVFGDEELK
ncbi:uncharacterized protein LOC132903963 isoform X2 [Amyelois transitella]|uniref:uncharacterized protein LOC106134503 n=1 Tax=Amyelois transitella TaxID=680683 RepID=UPI00067D75C3|nr:uncharacterized protein LOC106129457 isoform X2 [Amyelois transitella]XP_013190024.1 uncharacterized protein LOC106134503 [Amyelois transitella]XP_060801758.1 uncharacterized protein LOC132902066 [Amyelois transitella]XP_060806297.1 uncharacterized protein LOC132903055 [Amyelois transitella]XP_060809688.1 uncharacterized protein LOC132901755 isoform X2 [Amyelois transitella]XP_060809701.1 uncharacterized protein LOC132903963 isoform X2 [Amyelois transitella]